MHNVSNAYKRAMEKPLRDRGYIRVGLGAISLEAQATAKIVDSELAYWSSDRTVFVTEENVDLEYATYEENFVRADGVMSFLPEEERSYISKNAGLVTDEFLGSISVKFDNEYPLKGITLDFGDNYPTEFDLITDSHTYHYENDSKQFVSTDYYGEIEGFKLVPYELVNGENGRFRVKNMLMGIGLTFSNNEISSSTFTEYISSISEEVSNASFECEVIDYQNRFNVDSDSFINFLEIGQSVNVYMGMTLEDESVEWIKVCDLYLENWTSTKGKFTFTATDLFSIEEKKYTNGDYIHTRTAYVEAQNILSDMGISPDDYEIDTSLSAVTLTAPMPEGTHKECLQMLANACRCIVYQDYNSKIIVQANFATVIEPEDIVIDDFNSGAKWSKPYNVLDELVDCYGDYTQDYVKADGSFYFLPEDNNYQVKTGYVSKEIASNNGNFINCPKLSLTLEAAYTYYGFTINFEGHAPSTMQVKTYLNGNLVKSYTYTDLDLDNMIYDELGKFNKIEFNFTKGYPNSRVSISKIRLGDFNDFRLKNTDMLSYVYGTKEKTIKTIRVKVFSYEETEDEGYTEVDDDEWYEESLHTTGETIEVQNPLITTSDRAEIVAKWLANYYLNNVIYEVDYRGDARLNAADIIKMDSDVLSNLQVVVQQHELTFNGAWKGSLVLRKALRKGEE